MKLEPFESGFPVEPDVSSDAILQEKVDDVGEESVCTCKQTTVTSLERRSSDEEKYENVTSPLLVRYRSRHHALKRRSGDTKHSFSEPSDFVTSLLSQLSGAHYNQDLNFTSRVVLALCTCFLSALLFTHNFLCTTTHAHFTLCWLTSCVFVSTGAAVLMFAGVKVLTHFALLMTSLVTSSLNFILCLSYLAMFLFNVACFSKIFDRA